MADSNKTEKATEQRRKKAREQGQVVRSREFGSLIAPLGAVTAILCQANLMAMHWTGFYNGLLNSAAREDLSESGPVLFWTTIEVMRWTVLPLLIALLLSVGMTLAQGGFVVAPAALSLKFERLSPAARLGQIVSLSGLGGLIRSLLPLVLIAALGLAAIQSRWSELARMSGQDVRGVAALISQIALSMVWKSASVLLVAAALDYLLLGRQNESKLRMSHDEVKREHKENDGNPLVKLQMRRRQRALRDRKPIGATATATMVVTNPTHFAVALRYEAGMTAPEIVAKGSDIVAQKIKALAAEHNVPMIENKPLARALFKGVEVGHTIPPELYQAVAEILVAVFRAQEEVKRNNEIRQRKNAAGEVVGDL